jgi:hypothetical protein
MKRFTKQMRRNQYYTHVINHFGLDWEDANTLLSCERALHKWHEKECNGEVEQDEDTGKVWNVFLPIRFRVSNKEASTMRRLEKLLAYYNDDTHKNDPLMIYVQSDPRGCALYLYRKSDLYKRPYPIDACYSSIAFPICY